jgi:hypothetical protein
MIGGRRDSSPTFADVARINRAYCGMIASAAKSPDFVIDGRHGVHGLEL